MAIKTEETVRNNIIAAIQAAQPTLTTRIGSVVRDVLINPSAYEFGSIYSELSDISDAQSIWTAIGDDILALAKNYLIYQTPEVKAYGTVIFYSTQEPTTTITIPLGTSVTTDLDADGQLLQYTTVQSVSIPLAEKASYYNSTTGNWEVSCLVTAESGGTKYNVAANAIKLIRGVISGINGVYNASEISGGADVESETSVANRVINKLAGVNIGTNSGYIENVMTISGVQDALVVGPRDANMTRKSIGGVDIYVKGTLPVSVTGEQYTFSSTTVPDFIVTNRPVITSTPGTITNTVGTLVYGVDWEWAKDTTSTLQNSTKALDKVHWINPPASADGPLVVSYVYNGLIKDVQSLLSSDTQKILTSDVLVKWAAPVLINITCEIRIVQNYVFSDVRDAVELALITLLDGYYLGQEVQQSDILATINDVDGVYDVKSPLTAITSTPVITPDAYNNITIPSYYYATAGTITITQRIT